MPPCFQSDSQQLEDFYFEEAVGTQLTVSAWNANYSLKMAGVNVAFLAFFLYRVSLNDCTGL